MVLPAVSSPSSAKGWGKTIAGQGQQVSDSQFFFFAAPAAPAPSSDTLDVVSVSRPEGSQPAPGAMAGPLRNRKVVPSGQLGMAPIPLSPFGTVVSLPSVSEIRSDPSSIGSLGLSSIVPLSGPVTPPLRPGRGGVGGLPLLL